MSIEFSAYEYLVGKDIVWNLDSKYLRSVTHKLQRMELEGDISNSGTLYHYCGMLTMSKP